MAYYKRRTYGRRRFGRRRRGSTNRCVLIVNGASSRIKSRRKRGKKFLVFN